MAEETEEERRRRQQQSGGSGRTLPANAQTAATSSPSDQALFRGSTLYDNPQAALITALRGSGVDPYTSYFGSWMRRRYGNVAPRLFDLSSLSGQSGAGQTSGRAAVDANMANFQNFVNQLISGAVSGQSLASSIGFDPAQTLRSAFSQTPNAQGMPTGLGWSLFDEGQGTDIPTMRKWLQGMQSMLASLSGANPLYQQAIQNQMKRELLEYDAGVGGGSVPLNDNSWLNMILGRV